MILISLIREAASALWANRLRSSLTVLGMVVGVTSVIAIVATVEGQGDYFEKVIKSMGPNTFMVTRFGFDLTWSEYFERMKRKKLTVELIQPIEDGCPDCEDVGAEAYAGDKVKYGSKSMGRVEVRGETANMMQMRDIEILTGRYFSWEDNFRRRKVAFLGHRVYERFFEGEDPMGKKIRIGGHEFTVIGAAEKMDRAMISGLDNYVAIPIATHQKIYKQPGNPVNLVINAASLEQREDAMDQVRVVLRSARHLDYEEEDDFTIWTPDALLSMIDDLMRAFRVILISLPAMSIVIGGIVIMNIMMISVTERTREIGIRKSLGARQRNILTQFLYESVILSLIGGVIGIAAGVKLGEWILGALLDIQATPTGLGIILGFGISTGVGVFFGIYPAMRAARLDPIKALSYE